MRREVQEPVTDERGVETHPAYCTVSANRVTSTPGAVLFDSSVRHQHYIVLEVHDADRQRMIKNDFIHPTRQRMRIRLSMAQWGMLVSNMNSGGTPATLEWTREEGYLPDLPFDSRLHLQAREARGAAQEVFERVQEAFTAYTEHKTVRNLRSLQAAIENAGSNVQYAADKLTEHAEEVVAKARADIEAMVAEASARPKGIGWEVGPVPQLMPAEEEPEGAR